MTEGTIFHRTRTPLRKWLLAVLWMARELGLPYESAWLIAHMLRHALTDRPEFPLEGLVEVNESYHGGLGKPESRGCSLSTPNKSLLVMAVEKRAVGPGKGINASSVAAVKPGSCLVSDAIKNYAGLHGDYHYLPVVQGEGKNAERLMLIVHVLFFNVKTWLNRTCHCVSAKHLPHAREWNYRFNQRTRISDLVDFVLRRAMVRPTITYKDLVSDLQPWAHYLP